MLKEATKTSYRARSVRSGNSKVTEYISPMLATIHGEPFDDAGWIFEIKWDGYRAVAEAGKQIRLYSRNGLSFERLYPIVVNELKKIKANAILDGEIVVLNENGRPDFQKLQQYDMHRHLPILYYAFDCLAVNGESIMHKPLITRKEILRTIIPKSNIIQYSDHVVEYGIDCFKQAVKMDVEGIIAKKSDSVYTTGKRSRDWLKIKNHNTQEAIIAGYTEPKGSRNYFGALVLGIMQKGKLQYIGHTGTGFTYEILQDVYKKLQPLRRQSSPFEMKVPMSSRITWVEPKLVCTVKFTEITADKILRHPVFQGLRIDKNASDTNTIDISTKNKIIKRK
jgi:bifunctional non-homologous end joining protein LigD